MEDSRIVQLYWDRNQAAISVTTEKYGHYCQAIARNILGNEEDAEECVNDAYLRAWNSMPPNRPAMLSAYLGKITRNLSLNRYKRCMADKRGGGETAAVLEELEDCVSGADDTEQEIIRKELLREINDFLGNLPKEKRGLFVRRYWYMDTIPEVAAGFGMTENNVSVSLNRIRRQLRDYLTERGYML